MTCIQCEKPHTFNMNCRQCIIKHLRMIPKQNAKDFLRKIKEKQGEQEMLKLIAEVKNEPNKTK